MSSPRRLPSARAWLFRALLLVACSAQASHGAGAEPPGAVPNHDAAAVWRLAYRIPDGWISDRETASRLDYLALLLPEGARAGDGGSAIAIDFRSKSPSVPGLKEFFMSEMGKLLRLFPDLQSESWRPPALDGVAAEVASLEVYGGVRGRPLPQRVVMIDVGDGYYTISMTAPKREDLDGPGPRTFFAGLGLVPLRTPAGATGGTR